MQSAISTFDFTKVYKLRHGKTKVAVSSLDLDVCQGEIFGFLGPNGAGKTTTIKTLLGFIHPTSGRAEILGIPVDRPEARIPVGYLPEQPYFHKFMTPVEIISMHAGLSSVPRRERKDRVQEVIHMVGLSEIAKIPVSKLSKGQVQRIGLAQALVGDPKILILDEPASGLDPLGRRQVRDLLLRQREMGRTIFLSSHLLSEIETVCDRVAVLSHGKLTAMGTPGEIKEDSNKTTVTTQGLKAESLAKVDELGATAYYSEGDNIITVESSKLYDLIDILRDADLPLTSVMPERESLEDAFLRFAA
ncbi:MAG: ABC transporter ATP-binding protein [Armatimonadota bacterium]